MLRSIRSELLKVATTRVWWVLVIVLVVYVGVTAAGVAALVATIAEQAGGEAIPAAQIPGLVYSLATSVGYVFPLLFGAFASTGEFRHQTLTPTFLATPRRSIVLVGKVVAGALFGLVFALAGVVATVGLGAPVLAIGGHDPMLDAPETWALLGRIVIATVIWTAIGIGLGVLMPNQVAVIVVVLAFTQFVEPLLRTASAFWEWTAAIGKFLPGAASDALVGSSIYTTLVGGADDPLHWWQGGIVLGGFALAFLIAGALTTWRRDVT